MKNGWSFRCVLAQGSMWYFRLLERASIVSRLLRIELWSLGVALSERWFYGRQFS
uniref:Uncharacterized protein n=1 Tax=Arundo donax TaxID=35708 RepID=A0A0A8Z8L1_ARUDO